MALVFGEDSESTFIRTTVHDTIRTPTTTSAQGVVVRRSQLSTIPTKPIRLVKISCYVVCPFYVLRINKNSVHWG